MEECRHWYDPEIVEREKREKQCEIYQLKAEISELKYKLRQIRALTGDVPPAPMVDLWQQLEFQRMQALASSQRAAIGNCGNAWPSTFGSLFGGLFG